MAEAPPRESADLQRRYRRLRYPGLREAADLLVAAARLRVGRVAAGLTDPRWTDAVAVLGVLAAVLLLAKHLRPVAAELGWHLRLGDTVPFALPTANGCALRSGPPSPLPS